MVTSYTSTEIEKAIEILEERGWNQGSRESSTGEVCLAEALLRAKGLGIHIARTFAAQWNLFKSYLGGSSCIPEWNDDPSRTKEEVIDKLTEVAKDLRDKGL